ARKQGDIADARVCFEQALELYRQLDFGKGIANMLCSLGNVAYEVSDLARARTFYEESLEFSREIKDQDSIAHAGFCLTFCLGGEDILLKQRLLDEALATWREDGNVRLVAYVLQSLATLAMEQGDLEKAHAVQEDSLAIKRKLGDRVGIAESLYDL